jgi:hypothetical protein
MGASYIRALAKLAQADFTAEMASIAAPHDPQHALCIWLQLVATLPSPKGILDEKADHSFAAYPVPGHPTAG